MAITVLATPLDAFWADIEQRVRAHANFVEMSPDLWVFQTSWTQKQKIYVDFSIFDAPHVHNDHAAILTIDAHPYPLTAKEYAKLCLTGIFANKSTSTMSAVKDLLAHLFVFLKQRQESHLTIAMAEDFYASFLSMSVTDRGFVNRVSAPGYSSTLGSIPFPKARAQLAMLGVEGVLATNLNTKKLEKALNNACLSIMEMSRQEYKNGGSFDYLGLELGQYYVDFLKNRYERDYLNTLVALKTLRQIRQQHNINSLSRIGHLRLVHVIISGLSGIKRNWTGRTTRVIEHEALFQEIQETLFSQYEAQFEQAMSLNQSIINQTVTALGLEGRFDSVEVVRTLLLQQHWGLSGHKKTCEVWQGYLASLSQTEVDSASLQSLTVDHVYDMVNEIVSQHQLDRAAFLSQFHAWVTSLSDGCEARPLQNLELQFNRTAQAMTTLVVAYLGYRKSEFGFPLCAIHTEPNIDILDSAYVPFRFKLKWKVPKTNAQTKINREITSQCYQLAAQLHDLYEKNSDEPCLYQDNNSASGDAIRNQVARNWSSFVRDYQPFNEAIQLKTLLEKSETTLSKHDRTTITALSQKYPPNSAKYQHLLDTAQAVKKDLPRLLISNRIGSNSEYKTFNASLRSYVDSGVVDNEAHKHMIDEYLSDETKALLRSDGFELSDRAFRDIRGEILQGAKYPTPHAFRHIWAEAVLTRYQGDVGAVIRHQFCHLDNSFFIAYLRNKETRLLMDCVRQRFLNSLVETMILDARNDAPEFTGGFFKYVRRVVKQTKAIENNTTLLLQEQILDRIISFQRNPFADCIPREGADWLAKCSEFGTLNPHNAKPEFCLDCLNGHVTTGNIPGIVKSIQPMMKEAMQPHVMGFMVQTHLPTLRTAHRRITELGKAVTNQVKLAQILATISRAIDSIETKLKQEAPLYEH